MHVVCAECAHVFCESDFSYTALFGITHTRAALAIYFASKTRQFAACRGFPANCPPSGSTASPKSLQPNTVGSLELQSSAEPYPLFYVAAAHFFSYCIGSTQVLGSPKQSRDRALCKMHRQSQPPGMSSVKPLTTTLCVLVVRFF